jgi:uncharacterized membrane protein
LSTELKTYKNRNFTADLLKGLAVIFMVQVHIMEQFAKPDVYNGIAGKISLFFGGAPCAPVFMAVMGYFLTSSERDFSYFLKRGIVLFLTGILLNIARSANLLHYIINGQSMADPFFYIFGVDIFLLAGLGILIIGFLKWIFRKKCFLYFLTAILIVVAVPYLSKFATENDPLKYVNAFLWGDFGWSYFPLFPWLAYILLGFTLRLADDKFQFFQKYNSTHSLVFSIPLLIASGFTIVYATNISHDLYGEKGYYHHGILFFGWVVMFASGYAMIAHLINEYSGKSPVLKYIKWLGKNVTAFYIIQWVIIGNIATEIYRSQDKYGLIIWFFVIIILSSILTFVWEKIVISRQVNKLTRQK